MKSTVSAVEGLMGFPVCAKVFLRGGKLYYNVNIQGKKRINPWH
jgi:hypothetical protein